MKQSLFQSVRIKLEQALAFIHKQEQPYFMVLLRPEEILYLLEIMNKDEDKLTEKIIIPHEGRRNKENRDLE